MKKNLKGDGSFYRTIVKKERVKKLDRECDICKNCTDRQECNNRQGTKKCKKCRECKEDCLKYCDRFYCQEVWIAQATVKGKQKTITSGKVKKEVNKTKREKLVEIDKDNYIDKSNVTLLEYMNMVEENKLKSNKITESSYIRNNENILNIAKSEIVNLPIQKITTRQLQDLLDSKINYSQSTIDKVYDELNATFKKAVENQVIDFQNNPMNKVEKSISNKDKKKVEAFEIEEQKQIIKYISSEKFEIGANSKIDKMTAINLLKVLFATGARCGEICSLDYEENTDFENEILIINATLSKEIKKIVKEGNKNKISIKVGKSSTTKTGRKKRILNESVCRQIPFYVCNHNELKTILQCQIEMAKANEYNTNKLVFCNLDGSYITTSQMTALLKRICRELQIKPYLKTGCNIHMTKHTFVTRCIENGIRIEIISSLVGTSVEKLRKTYVHILEKFKNKEVANLNKLYEQSDLSYYM